VLEITFTTAGVFTWLEVNPGAIRAKKLRTLARRAHKRALTEIATMEEFPGIQNRFSAHAFAKYGLSERGERYQKWQRRVFGHVIPYFSPKQKDVHMEFLMKVPEAGFRVAGTNGGDAVITTLYLPGARILNRIAEPFGEIYRSEFLNLKGSAGGRATGEWVKQRSASLYLALIAQEIQRAPRRRKKVA
jgi:hypothetical protein